MCAQVVRTTPSTCTTKDCPRHCWRLSSTQWRACWTRTKRKTTQTSLSVLCAGGRCPMAWVHLFTAIIPILMHYRHTIAGHSRICKSCYRWSICVCFFRSQMCWLPQTVKEQSRFVIHNVLLMNKPFVSDESKLQITLSRSSQVLELVWLATTSSVRDRAVIRLPSFGISVLQRVRLLN